MDQSASPNADFHVSKILTHSDSYKVVNMWIWLSP